MRSVFDCITRVPLLAMLAVPATVAGAQDRR